jgi:hypothetical protein
MNRIGDILNEFGRRLQDRGWNRAARFGYATANFFDRRGASAWFNRGLIAKFEGRWGDSLEFNLRATELDPSNEGAWWNLGIAATALGDWTTARKAWSGFGIDVPVGEGPLNMNLGSVPIRICPETRGEVVWARRLDPARAQIYSVPLPESQHGFQDVVLHDGAPRGTRVWQGREVPVFNELQLLEPSAFATFGTRLVIPTDADYLDLAEAATESGLAADDWSGLEMLCVKCSEGTPHEHHEHNGHTDTAWIADRQVGIAAQSVDQARELIQNWQQRGSGRGFTSLECVFQRA